MRRRPARTALTLTCSFPSLSSPGNSSAPIFEGGTNKFLLIGDAIPLPRYACFRVCASHWAARTGTWTGENSPAAGADRHDPHHAGARSRREGPGDSQGVPHWIWLTLNICGPSHPCSSPSRNLGTRGRPVTGSGADRNRCPLMRCTDDPPHGNRPRGGRSGDRRGSTEATARCAVDPPGDRLGLSALGRSGSEGRPRSKRNRAGDRRPSR